MSIDANKRLDAERWLKMHGDTLYRFALLRTGNPDNAEDLVQETLLAAWRSRETYKGTGSERGWLLGILHHKAIDHLREVCRRAESDPVTPDGIGAIEEGMFDSRGNWRDKPTIWGSDPLELSEAEAFMSEFNGCLEDLSPDQRAAFVLREIDDVEVKQVSRILGVTANHLYVLLHRARLGVRRCLEIHWFGGHGRK